MKYIQSQPRRTSLAIAVALLTGACQTMTPDTPARLSNTDDATLTQVKTVLASALGRATIELGPDDLTKSSTISVLPPPLSPREDRSQAMPILFDINLSGNDCYAVRRDTGERIALGVPCSPET